MDRRKFLEASAFIGLVGTTATRAAAQLPATPSEMQGPFYPVVAQNDCLQCHTNANSGDVLGTIEISYPVNDLKVSLDEM